MRQVIEFLAFYGGGAALVGLSLGAAVGRTIGRVVALIALGVVLASVGYTVGGELDHFQDSPGCTDCGEGELVLTVGAIGNGIGWIAGVIVGSFARLVWPRVRMTH